MRWVPILHLFGMDFIMQLSTFKVKIYSIVQLSISKMDVRINESSNGITEFLPLQI